MQPIEENKRASKVNRTIQNNPGYQSIHHFLGRKIGKANKCENPECEGKSDNYEWALKKGCQYDQNVENFIQLCTPCHRKYDFKEETRSKIKKSRKVKPIIQINNEGGAVREFISICSAVGLLSINKGSLMQVLKGKRKTVSGFKFKYKV